MKRTADVITVETAMLLEFTVMDLLPLLACDTRLMCNFVKFADGQLKESCANNSPQVTTRNRLPRRIFMYARVPKVIQYLETMGPSPTLTCGQNETE